MNCQKINCHFLSVVKNCYNQNEFQKPSHKTTAKESKIILSVRRIIYKSGKNIQQMNRSFPKKRLDYVLNK